METLKLKVLTTGDFIKELRNPSLSALYRHKCTFLEERMFELEKMDPKIREKGREESLCCDVRLLLPFLEREQIQRFVLYADGCKFEGSELRACYDKEYLSMVRTWSVSVEINALMAVIVKAIGSGDFPKGFIIEDHLFDTLRTSDPALYGELLFHYGPWESFFEHASQNFDFGQMSMYGYGIVGKYGLEKFKEFYERMKPKLIAREIGWTEKFIAQEEKKI